MKKVKTSISVVMMILGAMALTFAATGAPGSAVTAGDLSRDLSSVARMAGTTEISRRLMTNGLGLSAGAPLTEARAVAILRMAGFEASTSNPDRLLTRAQADVLVRQFRSSLIASAHRPGSTMTEGGIPDTLDSCFDEKNHGSCVDCCKGMGGGASSCANACMVINKPSASEPLP